MTTKINYMKKSVSYFDNFEDLKIIDIDEDNKKIALVVYGKEGICLIFDANPYINYNPLENFIKNFEKEYHPKNDLKIGVLEIIDPFKISNYKKTDSIKRPNLSENSDESMNNSLYLKNLNSDIENKTLNDNDEENLLFFSNSIKSKEKYASSSLSITNFQIYYISPKGQFKDVFLSKKKPKIKSRLLSAISIFGDIIIGIKWFSYKNENGLSTKLKDEEKYIKKSKLLLIICQDGFVQIFKLIKYEPNRNVIVNLEALSCSEQPFSNLIEVYNSCFCFKLKCSIIDFHLIDKNYDIYEKKQNKLINLVILFSNNLFSFIDLKLIENKTADIEPSYKLEFQLNDFKCETFLIDSTKSYLICFNSQGLNIYYLKDQTFPFPIVYKYRYNEVVPDLIKLKTKIKRSEFVEFKYENKKNSNKTEKIQENENDLYSDNYNVDQNFIEYDNEIYYEDKQDLKGIQKPCFICCETKFIFEKYDIENNCFSLYVFDLCSLDEIEDNKEYLVKSLTEYEPNLLKRIYSSENKIIFSASPYLYFNVNKNPKYSDYTNIQQLLDEKIKPLIVITNTYQGIFIRTGSKNMFIKIKVEGDIDLKMIEEDSKASTYIFAEELGKTGYKNNFLAKWTLNNTIIINSIDYLFNLFKITNEKIMLGLPISERMFTDYVGV